MHSSRLGQHGVLCWLSVGARTELEFWAELLHDSNAQSIWYNPGVLRMPAARVMMGIRWSM